MISLTHLRTAIAGNYVEPFGPDNAVQIKNGQRFAFSEGQPLENLHDSHVHGAPR